MLQNAAKSICILWVTWEKRVVASWEKGGMNLHCGVCSLSMCVCVCVWVAWIAARSPGHPAAVEKLLMANAELLPMFHKTECVSSVQTDAQCHFQIEFMCVHVWWVGWVNTCGCAHCSCVCPSASMCTLYSCLCMSVFCSKQMFFPMCVLAESDQHQPVQWVWPRWRMFSAHCGQYYTHMHKHI